MSRAIVTFSRGLAGLATIRSLGRRGVEVIAGDEHPLTPGALSRYSVESFRYPSPLAEPAAFLDTLEAVVEEHHPGPDTPYVLLPTHREAFLLARARERFAGRIGLPLADASLLDRIRDKRWLAEKALEIGVPIPRTWRFDSLEELEGGAAELPLPSFVKARRGVAGVNVVRVTTRDELVTAARHVAAETGAGDEVPLVQAAAPGTDYCVTALYEHGERQACLSYRIISQYPSESGPGAIRETVELPAAEASAHRLLSTLSWHGVAQLDFRWTGRDEDEPLLIEVNPRLFGGVPHAVEAGVDYPWMLFQLGAGLTVDRPTGPEIGCRTEAPITGLLALARDVAERAVPLDDLRSAWETTLEDHEEASPWHQARALWKAMSDTLDVERRFDEVVAMLRENRENVGYILELDDPLPALGLLYPLVILARHGRVDRSLLLAAGEPTSGAPDETRGTVR